MLLTHYNDMIHDESRAQRFLSKNCLKNDHRYCPRCNQRKYYRLKDGRRRCSRCKYTFHEFSGRWINSGRLTAIQWLLLIQYFISELPARKVAEEMVLAYNTVLNAFNTLRYAILAHADDAMNFFCRKTGHVKCCYGGKSACEHKPCLVVDVPVFGVREKKGNVHVGIVPEFTPGDFIQEDIRKARLGSIVFAGPYMDYDSIIFYGDHHEWAHADSYVSPDEDDDQAFSEFSVWIRRSFAKYYGVSALNFPLYLKEIEFRYNHRDLDIFNILTRYMCDRMPMIEKS